MASRPAISSIAMALAGKTNTPSTKIPNSHDPRHAAGTDGLPSTHDQPVSRRGMLPTPPGSISPSIHPYAFKHRNNNFPDSPTSAPAHVDSDVDLHEEHQSGQPLPLVAETLDSLSNLESAGAITPAMLAKYHLPEILLNNGPLAIRHIMGYLTTNVPGFSGIAPAKARRLVVAALEGKGTGSVGDGINGDVLFEKVGWGRWDARRRGPVHPLDPNHATPPSSIPSSLPRQLTGRRDSAFYGSSMTAESVVFSHSNFGCEDTSMHEADKMSLDGDDVDHRAYCSSEASDPDDIMDGDWEEADLTDEEDWAQIGADALRARSFPHASDNNDMHWRNHGSGGGPSYATLTKSVPGPGPIAIRPEHYSLQDGGNAEERAAVEALLKLGSM